MYLLIYVQVEKSLQRIQSGQCNPMYTSQQSVENKVSQLAPLVLHICSWHAENITGPMCLLQVGGVPGWQALLSAVGFRLDFSGSTAGLPAAVFFPTSDPGDRLQQCSTTLQSLLGSTAPPHIRSTSCPAALHSLSCLISYQGLIQQPSTHVFLHPILLYFIVFSWFFKKLKHKDFSFPSQRSYFPLWHHTGHVSERHTFLKKWEKQTNYNMNKWLSTFLLWSCGLLPSNLWNLWQKRAKWSVTY